MTAKVYQNKTPSDSNRDSQDTQDGFLLGFLLFAILPILLILVYEMPNLE
jgi:hypothetical protein